MNLTVNEYEYARLVAAETTLSFDEVLQNMITARDVHNVSFRNYYHIKLHNFTEKTVSYQGTRLTKIEEDTEMHFQSVCEATGRTRAQILQDLSFLNDNPYAKVDIAQYDDMRLYEASNSELENFLINLSDRRNLGTTLQKMLKSFDEKTSSFDEILPLLDKYYFATRKTLLKSEIRDLLESLVKIEPDIENNQALLEELAADLLVCKRLLGFIDFEYVMFDLRNKSFTERYSYVSNSFRMEKVGKVNNRTKGEFFDNKALTYDIFKEFYGREAVAINSPDDFDVFVDFCKKHPTFVKKPLLGAMGSGVGLVKTDADTDYKELFDSFIEEMICFMCEELIVCHPDMKKYNPDSVNTIRVATYHDGKKTHFLWPYIRIGRTGAFVDNAGAGGITVAIDVNSGILFSDGFDECGHSYPFHPDNQIVFKGNKIPNWEGGLALAEALSNKLVESIEDIRFVGWDITYTAENKWVVIEGNTFPQLVHQAAYGKGSRAELAALIKD